MKPDPLDLDPTDSIDVWLLGVDTARQTPPAWPSVAVRAAFHEVIDAVLGDRDGLDVELTPHPSGLVIERLLVTVVRRAGIGSWALDTLCALADEHGVELALDVVPIRFPLDHYVEADRPALAALDAAALDHEQLVSWYGRRGFVPSPRGAEYGLIRLPSPVATVRPDPPPVLWDVPSP